MKSFKFQFSILFLFGLLLTFQPSNVYGQVEDYTKKKTKRAEKRAKRNADNEVNKSIDKEVDQLFSKLKDAFKKSDDESNTGENESEDNTDKSNNSHENNGSSFDFGGISSVDLDKEYHFVKSYNYDVEITDDGDRSEYAYDMRVPESNDPEYIGMETSGSGASGTIIFDHDINSMVVLTGSNSGTVMSFDAISDIGADQMDTQMENGEFSFESTGKTGKHLGFTYEEYAFESEESTGTVWMSKDESINFFKLFVNMGEKMSKKQKNMVDMDQFRHMDGLLIRSEMTMKNDGQKTIMELKDVEEIDERIDTSAYQLMDISSFMK